MTASASSAMPISSLRPEGAITRPAPSGLRPKAVMLEVRRRTGRSTIRWIASAASRATKHELISESSSTLIE